MASKSTTLILVLYFVFGYVHAGPSTTMFRGLKMDDDLGSRFIAALDPNDPKVVELGKFAIDEQNKDAKSKLSFGRVLKAASGGSGEVLRYGLVIDAISDSAVSDEYYAYVLVNQDTKELVAFKKRL